MTVLLKERSLREKSDEHDQATELYSEATNIKFAGCEQFGLESMYHISGLPNSELLSGAPKEFDEYRTST